MVKQEREDARKEEFEAENMRRALKGLPLEEWVEDEDIDEDSSDSLASSDSEIVEPEENEEETELDDKLNKYLCEGCRKEQKGKNK